uniref:Reverse transcriptase zinc-binding domain-containing protein n=1 Tax=Homalodisca liturata TaxID=320908 RepID=A0A1B6IU09_9HEMI
MRGFLGTKELMPWPTGAQPFCGVPRCESCRVVSKWIRAEHERRSLHPGLRMSRMVLQSPSSKVASDLLSLNRSMSSQVIGLITGHGHLRKHLHRVGILQEDPLCRMCDNQEETTGHLIFDCPAIVREHYAVFGSLEEEFFSRKILIISNTSFGRSKNRWVSKRLKI